MMNIPGDTDCATKRREVPGASGRRPRAIRVTRAVCLVTAALMGLFAMPAPVQAQFVVGSCDLPRLAKVLKPHGYTLEGTDLTDEYGMRKWRLTSADATRSEPLSCRDMTARLGPVLRSLDRPDVPTWWPPAARRYYIDRAFQPGRTTKRFSFGRPGFGDLLLYTESLGSRRWRVETMLYYDASPATIRRLDPGLSEREVELFASSLALFNRDMKYLVEGRKCSPSEARDYRETVSRNLFIQMAFAIAEVGQGADALGGLAEKASVFDFGVSAGEVADRIAQRGPTAEIIKWLSDPSAPELFGGEPSKSLSSLASDLVGEPAVCGSAP